MPRITIARRSMTATDAPRREDHFILSREGANGGSPCDGEETGRRPSFGERGRHAADRQHPRSAPGRLLLLLRVVKTFIITTLVFLHPLRIGRPPCQASGESWRPSPGNRRCPARARHGCRNFFENFCPGPARKQKLSQKTAA